MADPNEPIDQELSVESFYLLTTYGTDDPPEVRIVADVKHETDLVWRQSLRFTREQAEELIQTLYHVAQQDETNLSWP